MNQQLQWLFDQLRRHDIEYWADRGTLLGLLHENDMLAHGKDIEISVWASEVPKITECLSTVRQAGYTLMAERFHGKYYKYVVTPGTDINGVTIHINVFRRAGDHAWCPWTGRFDNFRKKEFSFFRRARYALFSRLRRIVRDYDVRRPPWSWHYDRGVWWIPSRFFESLVAHGETGVMIPAASQDYLSHRYGEWRTPVLSWVATRDDPTLVRTAPEKQVAKLLKRKGLGSRLADQHTYLESVDVMHSCGLKFWIDQGTLLGLMRDGKLIEHDHDIDLGVWREDLESLRAPFFEELEKRGMWAKTYKPNGLQILCMEAHSACRSINIAYYDRHGDDAVKRVHHSRTNSAKRLRRIRRMLRHGARIGDLPDQLVARRKRGRRFIIFMRAVIPRRVLRRITDWFGRLQYRTNAYVTMHSPARYFDDLEIVEADGLEVPVPRRWEEYLALKYGADWHVPKADWIWWKDDGAIADNRGSST